MTNQGWCLKHCGYCRFGFAQMSDLKQHLRKCSFYKCYVCERVGKPEKDWKFKNDFELENHWRMEHADHVGGLKL